jgi:hypothetical protein
MSAARRSISARRGAGVLALLALAACSDDAGPLRIRYRLTTDEAQTCPSASCADIPVTCDAVLQIRVVNPARPAPGLRLGLPAGR